MTNTGKDALLVGLTYMEAKLTNNQEALNMLKKAYSTEELLVATSSVAMAMIGIATRENVTNDTYTDTIKRARKTLLNEIN